MEGADDCVGANGELLVLPHHLELELPQALEPRKLLRELHRLTCH